MNTAVSRAAQSNIAVPLLNLVEFKVNLDTQNRSLKSFITGAKTFRSMLRMNGSTSKRLLLRTNEKFSTCLVTSIRKGTHRRVCGFSFPSKKKNQNPIKLPKMEENLICNQLIIFCLIVQMFHCNFMSA